MRAKVVANKIQDGRRIAKTDKYRDVKRWLREGFKLAGTRVTFRQNHILIELDLEEKRTYITH